MLGQLAAGRRDGEIAESLFISKKTASVHVSNILRKLDVANRVEAGKIGQAHGLADARVSEHAPGRRASRPAAAATPAPALPRRSASLQDLVGTGVPKKHATPTARPATPPAASGSSAVPGP